jgi:hypothetical protein
MKKRLRRNVNNIGSTKILKDGNEMGIGLIQKLVNGKRLNNMIDLDEPVSVNLSLLKGYNPLTVELWSDGVSPNDVKSVIEAKIAAINENRFYESPILYSEEYRNHIERVADLVTNPNYEPISIDVGIEGMTKTSWPIVDGNHRLAAALYRGDESILVNFSGSFILIAAFLQVSVKDFK